MSTIESPIILYTNPRSRGRIVRWILEEIGSPYQTVVVPYENMLNNRELLSINPMGKVPALRHGDAIVTETAAICVYLADVFPESKLAPAISDYAARASYYRWLFFSAGPVEAAVTNKALGVEVSEKQRMFVGYGTYDDTMRTLISAVEGKEYIAGDHFTAADVYVCSHIAYGLEFGNIEEHPALVKYAKEMKSRPAAIRAAQLDDALLTTPPGD